MAHQKRMSIPRSWALKRKTNTWITRPMPGAHSFSRGMSINTLLKEVLGTTKTTKETVNALKDKSVLVNGKTIHEPKYIAGRMDVISLPKLKEHYRIMLSKKGKIDLVKINEDESKLLLAKIIKKTMIGKDKMQLNFANGTNLIIKQKNDYKTGDTLTFENQKVKDHLKLEKGAFVYLMGGKHVGGNGIVKEIKDSMITVEENKVDFQTLKKYAFVIGKDKSIISIPGN